MRCTVSDSGLMSFCDAVRARHANNGELRFRHHTSSVITTTAAEARTQQERRTDIHLADDIIGICTYKPRQGHRLCP